jgi:predicted RNA binding protein YcfA (HicA-like mRNA interferase family)
MKMKGYSPREFESLLFSSGWVFSHSKGTHKSYTKAGFPKIITLPFHEREISRPLSKRLMKEAGIL